MPRHIVCLTFDFDTQSGFIARGMTTPTPLSRGEFGALASRRILAFLKSRGIATTWFTPGFTIESWPKECAAVVEHGHEIGSWKKKRDLFDHQPSNTLRAQANRQVHEEVSIKLKFLGFAVSLTDRDVRHGTKGTSHWERPAWPRPRSCDRCHGGNAPASCPA